MKLGSMKRDLKKDVKTDRDNVASLIKSIHNYREYINTPNVKSEPYGTTYKAPDRDDIECIDNPGFVGKTHITAYDNDIDMVYHSFEALARAVGIDIHSDRSDIVELENRGIFVEDPIGNLKRVEKMCAVFTDTLYTISLGDEFTIKIGCSGAAELATVEKLTSDYSSVLEELKDSSNVTIKHNVIISGRNLASLTYDIMNSDIAHVLHKTKTMAPVKGISIKPVRTKIYALQVEDESIYMVHGFYVKSHKMCIKED